MKDLSSRIAACAAEILAGIEAKTVNQIARSVRSLPAFDPPGGAFMLVASQSQERHVAPIIWDHTRQQPGDGSDRRSWRSTNEEFENLVGLLLAGTPPPTEETRDGEPETPFDRIRNKRVQNRMAYIFEEYPESVVAIYREDEICYSNKQKRYMIWNGRQFCKIKIFKKNGNVRFWIKSNSNKAGQRGKTWCMWASMRNWSMLSKTCVSFVGSLHPLSRNLLSLRPDQEWLRMKSADAVEAKNLGDGWTRPGIGASYMVPVPGNGISKYNISNQDRRKITNLRQFYTAVLQQPIGPQLASLPLTLVKNVLQDLPDPADRDLVVPVLVKHRVCLTETHAVVKPSVHVYFLAKFLPGVDHAVLTDYLRLCSRLQVKSRLRAQKFSSIREHHDELARTEREQREALDVAERQKRREAFKADPVFDVLLSNDKYAVEYIQDLDRLEAEGKAMHHCVGGYDSMIKRGECGIYHVRQLNSKTTINSWTLELRMHKGGQMMEFGSSNTNVIKAKINPQLYMRQFSGLCNTAAPVEVKQFVQDQLNNLSWNDTMQRFRPVPIKANPQQIEEFQSFTGEM